MAEQLKLVARNDLVNDSGPLDEFDLVPYLESGYAQKIGQDDDTVDEALPLVVTSSNDNNLAGVVQDIDRMAYLCRWSQNKPVVKQVWLRAQLTGETKARQAYLKDLKRDGTVLHDIFRNESSLHNYMLLWKRMAEWEDTALASVLNASTDHVATDGSTAKSYSLTGGDRDARIGRLTLTGGSNVYNEFWIGIRSQSDYGVTGTVQAIYPLHKSPGYGTNTTGGTSNVDAAALDGYSVITTMAGNDVLELRSQMRISNVVSNSNDQIGRYTVLLRAHCTSTLEARVRLRSGLVGSQTANLLQRVVPSTNYRLYPMGSIVIPPSYLSPGVSLERTLLTMDAEWAAGSGTLVMDSLIFIPEERMVHIENATVGGVYTAEVNTLPDGTVLGTYYQSGLPGAIMGVEPTNWGAARGTCIVVCAASGSDGDSYMADTVGIGMDVYGRWDTLRGAEDTV